MIKLPKNEAEEVTLKKDEELQRLEYLGTVFVIFAIPPDNVYLQKDDSRISVSEEIKINNNDYNKPFCWLLCISCS